MGTLSQESVHDANRPADTRYSPVVQKPYCCVPASLQIVLKKNELLAPSQESIGSALGLVVPPDYADQFEHVEVSQAPVVSSGFGTRIQEADYSLDNLIEKMHWPFTLTMRLASSIKDVNAFKAILTEVEKHDSDALICHQNDSGYGHVVVFDRVVDDSLRIIDPSPVHDKWREVALSDMFDRIQRHGDTNSGGIWILEHK